MSTSTEKRSHRILIVDDNPSIHEDFRKVFSNRTTALPDIDDFDFDSEASTERFSDLIFESAHQGLEAIEVVRKAMEHDRRFSLAFVDMRMPPGIDGLQTVSELWKIDPELQVVICTAYSDHTWEESVARLGHTDNLLILKKPFDDVEVLQIAVALTCKWDATREASMKRWQLEQLVRERTAELERAALHDGLTGLANRIKFNDRLNEVLRCVDSRNKVAAVLLIDLDQFKFVNDTMGHPAGDELIRVVGQRLSAITGSLGLVARFGGDEFAIVLDAGITERAIELFATNIQTKIAEPVQLEGIDFRVTASIGIAVTPCDGKSADELVRNCDIALYRAKGDGRDCVRFFEPGMDQLLRQRREWESLLRSAVERNKLELYYQPLVCAQRSEVRAMEALLRWIHPRLGLIPPDKFIPIAEETNLIRPIGDWVLMEACREAVKWPYHICVAVNVSAVQFRDGRLPESVARAITSSTLEPNRLEIEITESVLVSENADALDQLHAIRELGVRIALDDFGTGYSSLSYLRRFPFDKLKLDRSFLNNLDATDSLAIISTVANLGKRLGIETTAEGVETAYQLECVRAEGFTQIQGYFYGRPMPASQIVPLFFQDKTPTSSPAQLVNSDT